jgi:hypothetical protein
LAIVILGIKKKRNKMEQEERKRAFVVKDYGGRMSIFYGKKPWKEEDCWTCEGIGYKGWDNILPEYMPLSKELRDMKDGDGPIEVVLTPVYDEIEKKEIRSK